MNHNKAKTLNIKEELLNKGVSLMLSKGYNATGIDEICKAAGVTKGSFFYYFTSKEALGIAALDHFWDIMQMLIFEGKFQTTQNPLERLYIYLDSFLEVTKNPIIGYSCLFGNFSQELAATNPRIQKRCEEGFAHWEMLMVRCIEEAKNVYLIDSDMDPHNLAQYFIATFEGSLLLAKANQDTKIIEHCIVQYKNYLQLLFHTTRGGEKIQ